jgi:hypothetical protein
MKRAYALIVRGAEHTWSARLYLEPLHAQQWQDDGVELYEVVCAIPCWAQRLGASRLFCAAQQAWQWLRLF